MSFEYRIRPQQNVVFLRFADKLDDTALLGAFNQVYADPEYSPVMDQCIDYSAVTDLSITRLGVERLVNLSENFNCLDIKWTSSIVAPDDLMFGYARMYQILSDGSNETIEVVRTLGAALRILVIDPALYPFQKESTGETV